MTNNGESADRNVAPVMASEERHVHYQEFPDGSYRIWFDPIEGCEQEVPHWLACANALLNEVIAHDDENGALANANGDELRDALRVAAERLRLSGRTRTQEDQG